MPATIGVLDKDGNAVTVATNDALATILGEVQASPTSNTVLDRLKALATLLGGTLVVGDGGGSVTVDNGGTFAVQATVAAGATTIAKAEDAASADADVGVPAMAVRKATPANTSGTDGDYEMLQMSAGRLWASATIDAALPAGTNAIGKLAANSGVDIGDVDVTSLPALAAGTNTIGGTTPVAATSGGATPSHLISAGTTNATSLKASAGQVYGVQLTNKSTTAAAYVKLFNKASAPTVGSDTPVKVFTLPAAADATMPTVLVHSMPLGVVFGTGIAFAVTGGSANSDATAVASGDVIVDIDYK